MKPRLSTSKKWTAFPKEFSEQIKEVFSQNFSDLTVDGRFIVEGQIYAEEILLRVGYLKNNQIKQANFEVSCSYSQEKQDALEKIHGCVDAAASMLADYIEKEGEVDFPLSWKEISFQNQKLFLQFSTINTDLESQANALLGETDEALMNDGVLDDQEDALERAEIDEDLSGGEELLESDHLTEDFEDEDPEDDAEEDSSVEDEDQGPRLFGRPRKSKKQLH